MKTLILISLLLQLLIQGFTPHSSAAAKRYDLQPAWMSNNTRNLTRINLPVTSSSYRILKDPTTNADVTSDNGTFALAYFDLHNSGSFFFSVVLQSSPSSSSSAAAPAPAAAIPVWIANRNQSVSENSYLLLTPQNAKLILLDPTLRGQPPVWVTAASDIAGIDLQESGNLCLYSKQGAVLWQSFDDPNPNDVLLPNQIFRPGIRLVSNANASSFGIGEYSGEIGSQGLVLSVTKPGLQPQPYHTWSLEQEMPVHCEPVLRFNEAEIHLSSYQISGSRSDCGASSLSIPLSKRPMQLPYLRLDSDGDLVVYRFDASQSAAAWIPGFKLSGLQSDSCKLPNTCGSYGICEQGGKCRCMRVPHSDQEAYSAVPSAVPCPGTVPDGAPRGLPQPEECANENVNHHFVNVSGVSYFALPFMQPDKTKTSLENCAAECRWNCSCAALFFDNRTRDCFFVKDELLGSLTIDPARSPSMTALLKFVNRHIVTGPQQVESSSRRSGNAGIKKILLIAVAVAAGILIIGLSICVIAARQRLLRKNTDELEIDDFLSEMQGLPQRFSFVALEAATRSFSRKLGSGGFGSVYEGFLSDGRCVAVKKLEGSGDQGVRQFIAEVETIGSISHVNVVKLCGFCVEGKHRMLVYEFMPNGSLDRWLFSSRAIGDGDRTPDRRGLSWDRRMEIALGTARGLAYLHEECREPIIHLDVKPQNILLDERFVAKVADFGMSKLLDNRDVSHVVTGVRGTPGYLAPEWLLNCIATKKCDVYSYGMVLLELIGGRRNIEPSRIDSDLSWYFPAWVVNEAREGKFMGIVDEKIRASACEKQVGKMIRIALWCVQENAALRPTMHEVLQMMEGHREVREPPMDFHFAVQTMVDITASKDCVSMAYVSAPSFDISSLIR